MITSARWQRRFLGWARWAALITGACGISGKEDYKFGPEQPAGAGNGAGEASGGMGGTVSGGAATGGAVATAGSTDAGTGQTPELGEETAGSGGESGSDSGGAGPDSGGAGPVAGPDSGGAGPDSGDSGGAGMNEGGTSNVAGEGGLGGEGGVSFECTPSAKQCVGNGVQSCSESGVWGDAVACPPSARVCLDAGLCVPPSCEGLAATCGPAGNDSCCNSPSIPAGTFNRGNDPSYTATLSDFRLDAYEITVGRFRKFVAAYTQNMTTSGAGKNPNNPSDAGWNPAWNASLPADQEALESAVQCGDPKYRTWTAGNDNLPMNCINWFQAQAFCIWDGGRLPTDAEWNYAAAGGAQQLNYPWGNAMPAADAKLVIYGCYWNGTGSCTGVSNLAPVGSVSAGNGRWGHADLAGNLREWAQDWYADYPAVCNNCAHATDTLSGRVLRSGGFRSAASNMVSSWRTTYTPDFADDLGGARCARNP